MKVKKENENICHLDQSWWLLCPFRIWPRARIAISPPSSSNHMKGIGSLCQAFCYMRLLKKFITLKTLRTMSSWCFTASVWLGEGGVGWLEKLLGHCTQSSGEFVGFGVLQDWIGADALARKLADGIGPRKGWDLLCITWLLLWLRYREVQIGLLCSCLTECD